jgi:hypothetical protein
MRFVLITAVWAACVGCYREPTHPAQMRQNAESRSGASEPVMPSDRLHAGVSGAPGAIIESREVEIGTLRLTAPDDWVRREPSSQFLLAEFALPKAEGDADDGRLTVSSAGGTVEDNLTRWKGQFGGKPDKESQETIEVAGVKITVVDYTGTFSDQRGPFAPATPKAGYRMLGAVLPLDNQMFFIKGYGPEKTVAVHADKVRSFLQSLKPKQEADPKPSGGTP